VTGKGSTAAITIAGRIRGMDLVFTVRHLLHPQVDRSALVTGTTGLPRCFGNGVNFAAALPLI